MAIIFTSSRNTQKTFLWSLVVLWVLVVVAVGLWMFPPGFTNLGQYAGSNLTYTTPDIQLNFMVADSDSVKNLQPFSFVTKEFRYVATGANNRQVTGTLLAVDQEQVRAYIVSQGWQVVSVQESSVGRAEPFSPYSTR